MSAVFVGLVGLDRLVMPLEHVSLHCKHRSRHVFSSTAGTSVLATLSLFIVMRLVMEGMQYDIGVAGIPTEACRANCRDRERHSSVV